MGMIDRDRIAELRSEVGEDAFAEVVEIFLEELTEVTERLAAAAAGPQPPAADALAADLHFLKGAALNLGLAELATLCATGEQRAAAGDAAGVDLAAVLDSAAASRAAFLDVVAELG